MLRGLTSDPAYAVLMEVVDEYISRLVTALANPTTDEETLRLANIYRAAVYIRNALRAPENLIVEEEQA